MSDVYGLVGVIVFSSYVVISQEEENLTNVIKFNSIINSTANSQGSICEVYSYIKGFCTLIPYLNSTSIQKDYHLESSQQVPSMQQTLTILMT